MKKISGLEQRIESLALLNEAYLSCRIETKDYLSESEKTIFNYQKCKYSKRFKERFAMLILRLPMDIW